MKKKSAVVKINLISVPAIKLLPNPWNPNEQTDFIFEKERNSIRTHGFIDPILVRELDDGQFEIIDGEHRWKAAQLEGMTEIPCNNLGQVADSAAKQLTIIMNETRGEARRDKLSELLKDLASEVGMASLYESLPYQMTEIDALVNSQPIDWDQIGDDSNSLGSASVEGQDDFETVTLRLPEGVAAQLNAQIDRFKKALHPNEKPSACSPVQAIEAMCQHLAQIEDSELL